MVFSDRRFLTSAFALLFCVSCASIVRAQDGQSGEGMVGASLAGESLKDKVTALVEERKRTVAARDAYAQEVRDMRQGVESGKPLKDKAQALKLLALVRRHPDRSAAERQMFALLAQEVWTHGEVGEDVGKVAMNVAGSNIIATFDAFRTLIISAKPLGFTARERAEIAQVLYDRIRKDVDRTNTLIQIMVYGDLLTQLVDSGVGEVSDAIYVELLRWNEQKEAARLLVRKAARKNSNTMIGPELELMAPLGETLAGLARRLGREK